MPSSISGSINNPGDVDWIKVSLTAGQTYVFTLTPDATLLDQGMELEVLDSAGNVVDPMAFTPTALAMNYFLDAAQTSITAPTTGTYYLRVAASLQDTGSYTLSVSTGAADDYASNLTTTGLVAVGGSTSGVINNPGDVDWIKVSLTAGHIYVFSLTPDSTLADQGMELEVLDSAGNIVDPMAFTPTAEAHQYFSDSAQTSITAPTTGTYYLRVAAFLQDTGSYTLSVSTGAADDYASNLTTTGLVAVGGSTSGVINNPGDVDWIKVSLTAGHIYVFSLTPDSTLADQGMELEVLDSAGNIVDPMAFTPTAEAHQYFSDSAQTSITALTTGTYYLRVAVSLQVTGSYTLSVSTGAADDYVSNLTTTGLVAVGGSTSGVINNPGDVDWIKVSLTAGQTYVFTLTPDATLLDQGMELEVLDSAGNVVDPMAFTPTALAMNYFLDAAQTSITAPTTGTYYLRVAASLQDTGSYTLSVSTGAADDYASNLTTTGLVAVGGSTSGVINNPGDVDWIKVSLTAGHIYVFSLTPDSTLADQGMELEVLDSAGNIVDPMAFTPTAEAHQYFSDSAQTSITALTTGTYYLRVAVSPQATGSYTLSVANGAADDYASNTATTGVVTVGGSSLVGTSGNDTLVGTSLDDILSGLAGNDTLRGEAGNDTLLGGDGNDILDGGLGNDTINGGDGTDTLTYSWATSAVWVNLNTTTAQNTGAGGTDTITAVEKVIGGTGNDTLIGNSVANTLNGYTGNDSLYGGAGNDSLIGGDGNDLLDGGLGNDSINGGNGLDIVTYSWATAAVSVNLNTTTAQNTGAGGTDTITYVEKVIGGTGNDTLIGNGAANTLDGSAGNDSLYGYAGNDSLYGGAGSDSLSGGDGNDLLDGGLGTDTINGGTGLDTVTYSWATTAVSVNLNTSTAQNTGAGGTDTITSVENVIGGTGNDTIIGNSVANTLNGYTGNDSLYGGAGNDSLIGGDGNDLLDGGLGNDSINGGNGLDIVTYSWATSAVWVNLNTTTAQNTGAGGTDTITAVEKVIGGTGNDTLIGNSVANTLNGYTGNDSLYGGAGNDSLIGGDGNDLLDGGLGNDSINGGNGLDIVTYSWATAAVSVNLNTTTAQNTGAGGTDTITAVEKVIGGTGNDTLIGNSVANTLNGYTGNDSLYGGAGNDSLIGGDGNDLLDGGLGNDSINGGNGLDIVTYSWATAAVSVNLNTTTAQNTGAGGTDTITYVEKVIGGTGNDTLIGNGAANTLDGSAGNDSLYGYAGNDSLYGGAGSDSLSGGDGNDLLDGGLGTDTINGGTGLDTVTYSWATTAVSVNLNTSTAQNTGAGGTDTITSVENVIGGTGNDTIIGNSAANTLNGYLGNDSLNGGSGDDELIGGLGKDVMTGGAGNDVFVFRTTTETLSGTNQDIITDFASGDKISLSAIDANTLQSGDQAFAYSGLTAFTGVAGQLIYSNGIISGDINGDKTADLQIQLSNKATLTASSFIL